MCTWGMQSHVVQTKTMEEIMAGKKAHNVRTTKESGVPGIFIGNGEKTTNGIDTGRGRNGEESQAAFEKAAAKRKSGK